MTTIGEAAFALGAIEAEHPDERGAPFTYDLTDGGVTVYVPAKARHRAAEAFARVEGAAIVTVAAPRHDRRRAAEVDHAPGF